MRYYIKMNRDRSALINRLLKCKKGDRLTITVNSYMKVAEHDVFRRCPDEKISPAPEFETNQIAGFVEFRPLTNLKKIYNIE